MYYKKRRIHAYRETQIRKEEIQLSLLTDKMIFYIEVPKESPKVEQINELSEVEGHRLTYRNQYYSCILAMDTWTLELKIQNHFTLL